MPVEVLDGVVAVFYKLGTDQIRYDIDEYWYVCGNALTASVFPREIWIGQEVVV